MNDQTTTRRDGSPAGGAGAKAAGFVGLCAKVLALTGAALAVSLTLEPWIEPDFSPLFLGAVALSTRRWGVRAGIVSSLLTAPALLVLFLPPHYTLTLVSWSVALRLLSFFCTSALIIWLAAKYLDAQDSLLHSLEDVRTREARFRVALLQSPVVVFHQNADLRYIWVFNPFPEHTGLSLVGKLDSELFPAEEAEELTRIKRRVLSTGKGTREEVVVSGKGGRRTMDVTIEPFRDSEGNTIGLLGTAVDITEQKFQEAQLKRSGEQFRSLARRLNSTHEDQRALTSREIHDKISQMLAALEIELITIAKLAQDGGAQDTICHRLWDLGVSLSTTIESSERISAELRPSLLDNLGLASAIEAKAREFQARTGVSVVLRHLEPAALEPQVATEVFRIVEEALADFESRPDATLITLNMTKGFSGLVLQIEGNGRSRGAHDESQPDPIQLLEMRERAGSFGGTVTVHGERGKGTRIWVEIPTGAPAHAREACPGK